MTHSRSGSRGQDNTPSIGYFASDLAETLRVRLKERPVFTFAVAGGVGYVVGGGLTLGVLARLVGVAVRAGTTLRAQRAITDWLGMESRSEVPRQGPRCGDSK
jgi:hypothetical protein